MNKKEQEDSLKRLLVRLNCMLYDLDDAESKGFYAQRIKNLGNSLKSEIESKYREIFKGMIGPGELNLLLKQLRIADGTTDIDDNN